MIAALLGLFPAERQSVIILAFWVLVGAGVVVSVGAWILLRREPRPGKPPKRTPAEEPDGSEPPETQPAETGPASG
jgi:hypothetical protein